MYDKYFGFSDLPFSVTPNPRFFYTNPLYHEAFASLRYGIEARKGFVVITGEVGTGKTTLLKLFMRSAESTIHTAFIFNPKLSATDLLRFVLNDLGVPRPKEDRLTLMEQFNLYLLEQLNKDHLVAVLVDEAQDLSDDLLEELRLLSNFETDKDKLLQIVLMGQPELEGRLDRPELSQLKQRVALRCRLLPLEPSEVADYIAYRLNKAGYEGHELFDSAAMDNIIFYSRGVPRLINVICDNALLIAYAASKRQVSGLMVEEVARDLQIGAPSRTASGFKKAESREQVKEAHRPEFEEFSFDGRLSAPEDEPQRGRFYLRSPQLYQSRRLGGLGAGIVLGFLLVAGIGAASYSRNQDYLTNLAATAENVSQQSRDYFLDLAVKVDRLGKDYVSTLAVVAGGLSQSGRAYLSDLGLSLGRWSQQSADYVSGVTMRTADFIDAQWRNLKQIKFVSRPAEDNSGDLMPSKSTDSAANPPKIAAPAWRRSEAQRLEQSRSVGPAAQAKNTGELAAPRSPVTEGERRESTVAAIERSKPQAIVPQASSHEEDAQRLERQKNASKAQASFLGNFEVFDNSFVRDKPQTDAEIISTLRPGAWVRVEGKSGEYFRIRSLNDPPIRGYVHQEDAFFERIVPTTQAHAKK